MFTIEVLLLGLFCMGLGPLSFLLNEWTIPKPYIMKGKGVKHIVEERRKEYRRNR